MCVLASGNLVVQHFVSAKLEVLGHVGQRNRNQNIYTQALEEGVLRGLQHPQLATLISFFLFYFSKS